MRHRGPLALALGLLAAAAPAGAAEPPAPRALLALETDAYLDWSTARLIVTATGRFSGGVIANNAVALQVAGTDQWVDGSGRPRVTPLTATPAAVHLVNANTVRAEFQLVSVYDAVHIAWTAEAAGLAPTPFTGTCAGTLALEDGFQDKFKSC